MKRSLLWVVLAAFAGASLVSWWGTQRGWTELTIFVTTAGFMAALAVVRRGVTRPIMLVLIGLQAIPVFGLGTVALWAPPIIVVGVAVMWRIYIERLKRSTLTLRGDNQVAPGARRVVEDLLRLGFQTVGSVDAHGPDYKTIFTYLVSSDRRTFAVAADRVGTFASLYGGRIMVTIDRSSTPVPSSELRQLVQRGVGRYLGQGSGARPSGPCRGGRAGHGTRAPIAGTPGCSPLVGGPPDLPGGASSSPTRFGPYCRRSRHRRSCRVMDRVRHAATTRGRAVTGVPGS
jgi:hypothetical protein